ncbi:GIY-YIG nuclease family protein [Ekhidna sp.]|uniref:GIY-YIG nuclease family protein n=1 Tax=Ekhidna sp. TaxID=2608089 RepID=UPI003CCBE2D7
MYFVYILHSKSCNKYYKGQTNDLDDRLKRHNAGYENATSKCRPWKMVWNTRKETRAEAVALERKLKNLNRERLEAFMKKYS